MRITVLGSGSSGNSALAATERTCVLIDQGFGPRSIARRLQQAGFAERKIDGVVLTHGHSDHVKGAVKLAAKHKAPLYMNEGTRSETPGLDEVDRWERFDSGKPFTIGDMTIEAFPIPHDAAEPVGFRISAEGVHGALATDLGELDSVVSDKLRECDWLVLESNHDEEMLKIGPYPWLLKQRVLSRSGHLSNGAIAGFLGSRFDGRARHIFLAHLSRENNDPAIALKSARDALLSRRFALLESCRVHLTHQNKTSIVLNL